MTLRPCSCPPRLFCAPNRHICAPPVPVGCCWQVYEASGSLTACTWIKVPVVVPPEATFHDYLAMQLPADDVAEVPADPLGAPLPDTQHQAPAPAAAPSGLAGSGSVVSRPDGIGATALAQFVRACYCVSPHTPPCAGGHHWWPRLRLACVQLRQG